MIESEDIVRRAAARIGTTLKGKWTLESLLGSGGMASVFRATHRNGNAVAIKMLHLELSLDQGTKRRFLREGYAANAVAHPNIVRVLDDDVAEDGSIFLVMELLEGETLANRRHRMGQIAPPEVARVASAVLDVLASAHAKGVVHRDIKPDNVFLTRDGQVKVVDFGIAQVRNGSASFATHAGSTLGTPSFMAPEQALGLADEVDGRTDLWAVGAMMFWAVTGRTVHSGKTLNEQLILSATMRAPPLATVTPDVPLAFAQVIDRALAFEREARWQDASAMSHALAVFAGSIGGLPHGFQTMSAVEPGSRGQPALALTPIELGSGGWPPAIAPRAVEPVSGGWPPGILPTGSTWTNTGTGAKPTSRLHLVLIGALAAVGVTILSVMIIATLPRVRRSVDARGSNATASSTSVAITTPAATTIAPAEATSAPPSEAASASASAIPSASAPRDPLTKTPPRRLPSTPSSHASPAASPANWLDQR